MEAVPNHTESPEVPNPSLDEVLIALQKSFSRVSKSSYEYAHTHEGSTVALMVGNVDFELSLKVDISADNLLYNKKGGITLTFKGQIDLDHHEDTNP